MLIDVSVPWSILFIGHGHGLLNSKLIDTLLLKSRHPASSNQMNVRSMNDVMRACTCVIELLRSFALSSLFIRKWSMYDSIINSNAIF